MSSADASDEPRKENSFHTGAVAMPKDTNPNGDIFGGWLMAQMDLGSGILASKRARTRVVTVAVDGMSFLEPVRVGDTVACYAWVESIGRTSMKIPVEAWVQRYMEHPANTGDARSFHLCGGRCVGSTDSFRGPSDSLGYCPPPSLLIDSGPETSVVSTGSDGCITGIFVFL